MGYALDETQWPVVVCRWADAVSDAEVADFLSRMRGWLDRKEPFGLVLDSRGAEGLSPEQRATVIAFMKQHSEPTKKYLVQAIVIDSVIQRTLYYAMNWMFPYPFPSKAFEQPQPARAWVEAWLKAKTDQPVSPAESRRVSRMGP